ncbi:helix-turn-helix domain-containing protein [Streptomyces sp. NBC_01136]|uniref:helix-turn-helix domain-containing protein n=1 Tax=unclassified Streptomyces TaxID=2593676 RepID=UPI00325476A5|nr:helix-turn-helix domain-containing protein [Streptomyces sp. NBC_01136]
MGAWQPLPEEFPAEVRHFVEQLRLLKDRTGLSLVALGARTAYSKSSWQRYLNATQPPPRQAVVALCRVAGLPGEETERFGVRWELAVRAWPREPAPVSPVSSASSVSPISSVSPGRFSEAGYEEDPTLPWWDLLDEEPRPAAAPRTGRLLLYAALLALALLLAVVAGAVTLG